MNTVIETPTYNGSTILVDVVDISCISLTFHSESQENMFEKSGQALLSSYVLGVKPLDEVYHQTVEEEDCLVSVQILFSFDRLSDLTMTLPMAYDFMCAYKKIQDSLRNSPEMLNNKNIKTSERLTEQKIESFSKNMAIITNEILENFNANVEKMTNDNYEQLKSLKDQLGVEIVGEHKKLELVLKQQQEQNEKMLSMSKEMLKVSASNFEKTESRVAAILDFIEKFTNTDASNLDNSAKID